jgi:hypothetical protein
VGLVSSCRVLSSRSFIADQHPAALVRAQTQQRVGQAQSMTSPT